MQANLGLKRCKRCEELLALASWLLYSEPKKASPLMRAQLSRLFGQLHTLMGRCARLGTAAQTCLVLGRNALCCVALCFALLQCTVLRIRDPSQSPSLLVCYVAQQL